MGGVVRHFAITGTKLVSSLNMRVAGVCGVVAGAQPGHTFPEQGGAWRTPKDTGAAAFEFSRTLAEPSGPSRTRHRDGSGP